MKTLYQRFDDSYIPEPNSGCWLWEKSLSIDGYGKIWVKNQMRSANRVSFERYKHKLTNNEYALHKCDNPSCVNPDHLFCGSKSDNNKDRMNKGRSSRGCKHHQSKLSNQEVLGIFNDTRRIIDIAISYNISQSTICDIKAKRTWGWLTDDKG